MPSYNNLLLLSRAFTLEACSTTAFKVCVCSALLDQDSSPQFQTRVSISTSLRRAVERGWGWTPPQLAPRRELSRAGVRAQGAECGLQRWAAGVLTVGCRGGMQGCRVWHAAMGCKAWDTGMYTAEWLPAPTSG